MADWAHEKADETINEIYEELEYEYARTQNLANKELKNYLNQFEDERKEKRERLGATAFAIWAIGRILSGKKWAKARDKIVSLYVQVNVKAAGIINKHTNGVFKRNYDYFSYLIGKAADKLSKFKPFKIDKLKDLWRKRSLWRKPEVNTKKDERWHKQKLKSIVQKGVQNGESITQITKRMENLGKSDEALAKRNANTAITGAENAGRLQSMEDAENKGVYIEKMWVTQRDNRVRPSHQAIDGEQVPIDQEFSNGLMYPGDMNGDPAEYMNCRCRLEMVMVESGVPHRSSDYNFDLSEYEEWL